MVRLIAVGKVREPWLTEGVSEYVKRLSGYTKIQIIQVPDEKCPETLSDAQRLQVMEKEGRKILDQISAKEYVITLEIKGKHMSSEELAEQMEMLRGSGRSDISFVIGGSLGLSKSVSDRADLKLSFSRMTFPHQLMRVILLEQLYRSFKIAKNEPYHK